MTTGQRGERASADTRGVPGLPPVEEREWTSVLWEVTASGVLAITLNRPEHLNALSHPLIQELNQLLDHAAATPEVRVVTLRGAGIRAFSSGDDLKGMGGDPLRDNAYTGHHELVRRIRSLEKPVVALIHGWALGAGYELAVACDFRLCADDIEVGDHRVTRAIGTIMGSSWFTPRLVGRGRALELLMTGRHLDAKEALEWGWANRVWPAAEFELRAAEYVEMLAKLPTRTAGMFKHAIDYSSVHGLRDSVAWEAEALGRLRLTEDSAEGRASFIERREPDFKGR